MKTLKNIRPTPEQLKVIQNVKPGVTLIRGAAGSGKTTTALLRLRLLADYWQRRHARLRLKEPVRILMLTFNRTLKGYIENLVSEKVKDMSNVVVEVSTFGFWSKGRLDNPTLADAQKQAALIRGFGKGLGYDPDFIENEVDYILGRFLPENLDSYLAIKREGRGTTPQVNHHSRSRILEEVIAPYTEWKREKSLVDWNDMAVQLARSTTMPKYDIIVVDEAQDFSANQVRALLNHAKDENSVTFVLDAIQRIYARFFRWTEVKVTPSESYRLKENFRNTKEIAAFARTLVVDLPQEDDGTLPDFDASTRTGPLPKVLVGTHSQQVDYAIKEIRGNIDLDIESVAFLHPKGGRWFDFTKRRLAEAELPFLEISRRADWPEGNENIALSTLHSAKGLEFDHVFLLGLNAEVTPHGAGDGDYSLENLRRLVAMAIGRAVKTAAVGYKESAGSTIVSIFEGPTYEQVDL